MSYREDMFDKIKNTYGLESIADLEYEAASILMDNGEHIISWTCDLTNDFGIMILMMPYVVGEVVDEVGHQKVFISKMMPYSMDLYFPIPSSKIMTVGDVKEVLFDFYQGATNKILAELEKDPNYAEENEVDTGETNVVSFKPKETLH